MSKFDKYEEMNLEDLEARLLEISQLIFSLSNQGALSKQGGEKPHLPRFYRREKARVLTCLNMKKRQLDVNEK